MKDELKVRRGLSAQAVLGLALVAVGVVFLLQTLGLNVAQGLVRWIPLLFVLLGVWQLVVTDRRNWLGPALLIVAAGLVQLAALDVLTWGTLFKLWPLALVAMGLSILLGWQTGRAAMGSVTSDGEFARVLAIFAGSERQVTSQNFRGAEVTALFGGASLDLRTATVAQPPARVQVFAMFGGVGMKASADMLIRSEVVAIFGGAEDNRRQRKMLADERPEVLVTGLVMFGAFEIKDK